MTAIIIKCKSVKKIILKEDEFISIKNIFEINIIKTIKNLIKTDK